MADQLPAMPPAVAPRSVLNRFFSSSAATVLVPLLSLLVGFTLTSWKDDILATLFTGIWQEHTHFNGHATTFWLLICLLSAVVWGSNWAKNVDSARTTGEVKNILDGMHAQSNKLTDAVTQLHSLPPRGVLEACKDAYDLCEGYFVLAASVDPTQPGARVEMEGLVRKMLGVIERFIRTFDGEHLDGSPVRYGLNIMVYVPRADLGADARKAQVAARLRFAGPAVTLDSAAGVLDIVPAMSVASGSATGDPLLQHLALLIDSPPKLAKAAHDSRTALPGATDACINMIHTAVPSIEYLAATMDRLKTDATAKAAVLDYFGQDVVKQTIQSFVCVPLIAKDTGMTGVLNIHRDVPNLTIEDKLALLVPLITPFRHQLARVVAKYKALYSAGI